LEGSFGAAGLDEVLEFVAARGADYGEDGYEPLGEARLEDDKNDGGADDRSGEGDD